MTSAAGWSLPADARSAFALLDVTQARAIDRAAIDSGIPEFSLMERAGAATAAVIQARWQPCPTLVLAGPGNNGGDGFVVARLLGDAGWPVKVACATAVTSLTGAAALAAAGWQGAVSALTPEALAGAELIVDAIFGIGLTRPLAGVLKATVEALNALRRPVVAVDIPSGIETDSGAVLGAAVRADLTVTFFRRKPAHLLLPGRDYAGEVVTADLDVPQSVYGAIPVSLFANDPGLWLDAFPWPDAYSHKYTRGHAVVLGGTRITGAARLAAHAAQRIGAGLVTIAADPSVVPLYAAWRADLLIAPVATPDEFRALLEDRRLNAVLLGPGAGADARLAAAIGTALDGDAGIVLDADSFSILADRSNGLFGRLGPRVIMTPHEGEFARLFGAPSPRLEAARRAARESGATVLLKGADTVIADSSGAAVINSGAPPELATAGSGDVLAGLIVGLVANGLPPTLAGLIAGWVHGRAAQLFGPGLIAGDLPDLVPNVLTSLKAGGANTRV